MKIIIKIILFFLFLLVNIKSVFAVDYFYDDFNSKDTAKWNFYNDNLNNIYYNDGTVLLSTKNGYFPILVSRGDIFPKDRNFNLAIKFKYLSVTSRGVGLGVGFTGTNNKLFSQFGIWNDSSSGDNLKFYYNDFSTNDNQGYCSNFTNTIDTFGRKTIKNLNLANNTWHIFEINKIDQKYYIYLDKDVNTTPIYVVDIKNNCIPNIIWFGNFVVDAGGPWTTFSLDYVKLFDELIPTPIPTNTPIPTPTPTFTPTPTPTPIPIPKKKIFILPGLGASWNPEAIVYNKNISNNDWKMTPFVNNYDGLIENLEKNGLVRNQDFFVWNYDWRKSISEIENNFNIFIESKNISNNDEIYLIGHSLGGVVARIWGQEHSNDQRLKNIITLGSPHLGSLDVYTVWNGGKVANSKGLSSVIFQILLNLQNKGFITDLNKLRVYAPVVKDLLPTYDNYVSRNGILLKQNQLETKNNFLIDKNNQVNKISDKLFLSTGVGFSTPNIIKLINRSVFDKTFGLWPDGKFVGYGYENGDGTVLKNSASFGSTELTELNSDHGEIVNNSLTFIMSKLGLESKKVDFIYNDNFANSLIVFVGSPATVSLKCENDIFNEVDGFVVINNKNYKDCSLNLNPIDNGTVHLVVGNTNNNDWNYIEKKVSLSNKEKVIINFSDGSIKIDKLNKDFLISWIKSDLQQIKLDSAIKYLEKGNLNQVVKMVFVYRWKTKEMIVSQRILNNLFILGSINKPNKKNINYKWIYINKDYLSKRIKNNRYSVYSFDKLNKFIEYKKYPDEEMARSFFDGYLMEALGN